MLHNKALASDWLNKAWHHLSSGKLLFDVNHYTDTISVDLHYAVEIMMKSYLVYGNKKIIKTHNLMELYTSIEDKIYFNDYELDLLDIISKYHIKGSYPVADRCMPSRDEIKEVLDFAEELFDKVCVSLDIDENEVKK